MVHCDFPEYREVRRACRQLFSAVGSLVRGGLHRATWHNHAYQMRSRLVCELYCIGQRTCGRRSRLADTLVHLLHALLQFIKVAGQFRLTAAEHLQVGLFEMRDPSTRGPVWPVASFVFAFDVRALAAVSRQRRGREPGSRSIQVSSSSSRSSTETTSPWAARAAARDCWMLPMISLFPDCCVSITSWAFLTTATSACSVRAIRPRRGVESHPR